MFNPLPEFLQPSTSEVVASRFTTYSLDFAATLIAANKLSLVDVHLTDRAGKTAFVFLDPTDSGARFADEYYNRGNFPPVSPSYLFEIRNYLVTGIAKLKTMRRDHEAKSL